MKVLVTGGTGFVGARITGGVASKVSVRENGIEGVRIRDGRALP